MAWILVGGALSVALTTFAFSRSRASARGGYYDAQQYALTIRAHRRFGAAFMAFAAAFAACMLFRANAPAPYLLAAFVLLAVFYLTSFLRGFSDEV